jgi:cobalamin biosynthesis protein CobT
MVNRKESQDESSGGESSQDESSDGESSQDESSGGESSQDESSGGESSQAESKNSSKRSSEQCSLTGRIEVVVASTLTRSPTSDSFLATSYITLRNSLSQFLYIL